MRINVLGVGFDALTMDEAVAAGARMARSDGFCYVVTPNPEFVMSAREDSRFAGALNAADLVLPDGIGIIYAAKLRGTPLPARVPGIDFASGLMKQLAQSGQSLFLLGAKPGVAEQAAARLQSAYPGLVICGTHHGYFTDDAAVAEVVRASGADVVFVCLGAPRQEFWMTAYGPSTGAKLMVGLGGALDVFSGTVARAPAAWQKLGLEWLYRLLRQPSRLGRMVKLPAFLALAAFKKETNTGEH